MVLVLTQWMKWHTCRILDVQRPSKPKLPTIKLWVLQWSECLAPESGIESQMPCKLKCVSSKMLQIRRATSPRPKANKTRENNKYEYAGKTRVQTTEQMFQNVLKRVFLDLSTLYGNTVDCVQETCKEILPTLEYGSSESEGPQGTRARPEDRAGVETQKKILPKTKGAQVRIGGDRKGGRGGGNYQARILGAKRNKLPTIFTQVGFHRYVSQWG